MTTAPQPHEPTTPPEEDQPALGNYFISTYPPFSTWSRRDVPSVRRTLATPPPDVDAPWGVYVHIPFCADRCHYCYYLAHANAPTARIEEYLDAVIRELALYRRTPALADRTPTFVYFGGGTPSLLTTAQTGRLIRSLQSLFPWTRVREATFECAPRSVSDEKLHTLRDAGITRISLGVQQLDDDVLKRNGRIHRVADIERAYAAVDRAGFDVVNVDLIVGLITETDDSFHDSLTRVIEWQPQSITLYQLEIPFNTPLSRILRNRTAPSAAASAAARATPASTATPASAFSAAAPSAPDAAATLAASTSAAPAAAAAAAAPAAWSVKRRRLAEALARLERHGYTVRSAYAAVRDPVRHRFVYQDEQYHGADLLGLGAASFSYLAGVHHQNHTTLRTYVESLRDHHWPHDRAHVLSDDERAVREFILRLKLGRANAARFLKEFGFAVTDRFAEPLARLRDRGWLAFDADGVTLTRAGLLRADHLCRAFYLPQHRAVRYT